MYHKYYCFVLLSLQVELSCLVVSQRIESNRIYSGHIEADKIGEHDMLRLFIL
jgi:hypothetical protein